MALQTDVSLHSTTQPSVDTDSPWRRPWQPTPGSQCAPKVWDRGLRKPQMSRPSSRKRSKQIFLHSNSSQRHSLQSDQRVPCHVKSLLRLLKYWYSGITGIGGFEDKCVNWPYQYQRLMGMKKKFTQVSQSKSLRSYSVTITQAARCGGSISKM